MASELGYRGGKSIFDDYVREVRPRFQVCRTFQLSAISLEGAKPNDWHNRGWESNLSLYADWIYTRAGDLSKYLYSS